MSRAIVIAGTDTGIGKTVFAAGLSGVLDACYWKPVQAGIEGETDAQVVQRLSGLASGRILPEAYRLRMAASPHLAAEAEGVTIDVERLAALPEAPGGRPLVVELAGGLLVPLTRNVLQVDVVARWGAPVVLVAATRLGTINHTLLSLEALKARGIAVAGVAFVGDAAADSEAVIAALSGVRRLGRLPRLDPLDGGALRAALLANFRLEDLRP
jgi:dethiobiotin synthetase